MGYHSLARIELSSINPRRWRLLFGRLSVVIISLSISKRIQKIGRGRKIVDSRRIDSNPFHIRIPGKVHN
jgi:hypothetical protein